MVTGLWALKQRGYGAGGAWDLGLAAGKQGLGCLESQLPMVPRKDITGDSILIGIP